MIAYIYIRYSDPFLHNYIFPLYIFIISCLNSLFQITAQHVCWIEVRTLIWTLWYTVYVIFCLSMNRDLLLCFGSFFGFWLTVPQLCFQTFRLVTQFISPPVTASIKQPKIHIYSVHVSEFVRSSGVGSSSDCVGLAGLILGQGRGCVHRMFCWSQTLVPPIFISMVPPHEMDRLLWLQQIPQIPCPLWDSSTPDAQHILCCTADGPGVGRRESGIEQWRM